MVAEQGRFELLGLEVCDFEEGTVGAMVDYVIQRFHAGNREKLLEVFMDIQKMVHQRLL